MADTGKTIALIKALSGGGALPPITDADNGKVLTANSGVWVAANPSGGGVFEVHATRSDNTLTLDKTWQEIYNGGFGVVVLDTEHDISYFPIISVGQGLNQYIVTCIIYGDTLDVMMFRASSASGYPVYNDTNP